MTPFSCALIGSESLLIGCAEALLARGHSIRAVVSEDPEIRAWAADKGLTTLDSQHDLQGGFDWLLSIANLTVIPDEVLAQAAKGAVNFHDGPLPAYAGLNTPNWALINGEAQHGITWHLIEGGVDEGDILAQRMFDVAGDETAFSLNSKCYAAAMDSFGEVMAQLESGALNRQPQDLSQRRVFAKSDRPAAGGLLDFSRPAEELARLVRALDTGGYWNPLALPKIETARGVYAVAAIEPAPGSGAPGTVLVGGDAPVVACADGALKLTLTCLGGLPVTDVAASGEVLLVPPASLTDAMARVTPGEGRWRKELGAYSASELATKGAGTGRMECAIPGLSAARAVAILSAYVAGSWAYRGTATAQAHAAEDWHFTRHLNFGTDETFEIDPVFDQILT